MINFSKYDLVVVKFPFASSLKYKARPAVILSSDIYNENKLDFELEIKEWEKTGLLKPSIFKASIATIEKDFVISKLGTLLENDITRLEKLVKVIC